MSRIKTRDSVRGIKAPDRANVIGERMRKAFVRTKEKTAELIDDDQNTADEYAAEKVQTGAEEAVVDTGRSVAAAPKRVYDRVHGRITAGRAENVVSENRLPVYDSVEPSLKQSRNQSEYATTQNRDYRPLESKTQAYRSTDVPSVPHPNDTTTNPQTAGNQEHLHGTSTFVEQGRELAKNDAEKRLKRKETEVKPVSNDSTISADTIVNPAPPYDASTEISPAYSPKEQSPSPLSHVNQQSILPSYQKPASKSKSEIRNQQESTIRSRSIETNRHEPTAKELSKTGEIKKEKPAEPIIQTARQDTARIPGTETANPQQPAVSQPIEPLHPQTSVRTLPKNVETKSNNSLAPMNKTVRRETVSIPDSVTESPQQLKIRSRSIEPVRQETTARNTLESVDIRSKKTPERTIKTAQQDIKQSERTIRNTQQATKAAVSSAKTASATVKNTQRTAQATRAAAQKAETAAKKVAHAVAKAIKAIAAGIRKLVAAIAAGGWTAVLAVIIICLIGCIVASPFGIFFAGENCDAGSVNLSAAVARIQYDFNERLEDLQDGEYDSIEFEGALADWPELISVFAVKVADADGTDAMDVATLDVKRLQKLEDVFWDANQISSHVDTIGHGDSNPEDEVDDSWAESILHIEVSAKTAAELMEEYRFSDKQKQLYAELMEERATLESLIGETVLLNTEAEAIIRNLPEDLAPVRKAVVNTACSLVGKVNYFWGGKSLVIGWDSRWGTIRKVTAEDSPTTGTYRPYGLDCSGFVDWVFYNATDGAYYPGRGGGAAMQHSYCIPTMWGNAEPGDLVFYPEDSHVGIVAGFDENGEILIIHCASGYNNVVVTGKSGFEAVGKPIYYR